MVKFAFKGQSSSPVQYSSPVVQSSEWIHPPSRAPLGEEGMQLVQPSKFFTIFRTCCMGRIGMRMRTWAMLLFLEMLKNFDVCTVTMGVACPLLRRSIHALASI